MEEKARKSKQAHDEREKKRLAEETRKKAREARDRADQQQQQQHSNGTHEDANGGDQAAPLPTKDAQPGTSQSFISKLQKEVQLMMRLDHPNIVRIYQVLETEEECFIVMYITK